MHSSVGFRPRRASLTVNSILWGSIPQPRVAFDCGSRSINKTDLLALAKVAAILIQDVVFPTPPF